MKTKLKFFTACVTFCGLLGVTFGICTYSPLREEITALGRKRTFCDYRITKNNNTVTLSMIPGSKIRTDDCTECICSQTGLKCCGLGIKDTSNIYVPQGCMILADGCDPVVVMKSNNRSDCFSGRPVLLQRQEQRQQREFNKILTAALAPNMPQRRGRPIPHGSANGGTNGGITEEAREMMQMMMFMPLLNDLSFGPDQPATAAKPTAGVGSKPRDIMTVNGGPVSPVATPFNFFRGNNFQNLMLLGMMEF